MVLAPRPFLAITKKKEKNVRMHVLKKAVKRAALVGAVGRKPHGLNL